MQPYSKMLHRGIEVGEGSHLWDPTRTTTVTHDAATPSLSHLGKWIMLQYWTIDYRPQILLDIGKWPKNWACFHHLHVLNNTITACSGLNIVLAVVQLKRAISLSHILCSFFLHSGYTRIEQKHGWKTCREDSDLPTEYFGLSCIRSSMSMETAKILEMMLRMNFLAE